MDLLSFDSFPWGLRREVLVQVSHQVRNNMYFVVETKDDAKQSV